MAYSTAAQSYMAKREAERLNEIRSAPTERSRVTRPPAILDTAEDTGEYTGKTDAAIAASERAAGYLGGKTSQQSIEAVREAISPTRKALGTTKKIGTLASMFGQIDPATMLQYGPLMGSLGVVDMGLGAMSALVGSAEEGWLGDMFDARENETARDALEDSGMSIGLTKTLGRNDKLSEAMGWGRSAYGLKTEQERLSLSPTLSNIRSESQELSRASGDSGMGISDAPGYGGTLQESARDEMSRASGDSGAGYGSLGDAAGGNGAGDSGSSGDGSTGRAGGPDSDAGSVGF